MGEALVCKRYVRVAFSQTAPKEAIFTRLRCKQWSCPACAKKNASIWREFLKEKLPNVSSDWYLLTLTAHRNTTNAQQSLSNIRNNIDTLFKRVKRVFGRVSYVRTYERHPTSRRIHAHFIIAGLSPYVVNGFSVKHTPVSFGVLNRKTRYGIWSVRTWFKINAQQVGMGMIADVRRLTGDIGKAVHYVCKYLTKAQQDLDVKGLRHVQTSRDIGSPKGDGEMVWDTAAYITAKMFPPNTAITDLNTGQTIDNDYWEVHNFYPYE